MKTLGRARRGTATVELAVLMIVLVPTIMYTLFLNDLLFFRMKQQETIISTTWDFTAPGSFDATHVQTNGRQTYIDHTGEWNTYTQPSFDSNPSSGYHQGLAAHECWLVTGAVQVTCTNDGSPAMGGVDILTQGGGGLGRCRARLGVLNYFLQQNLFGTSNFGRGQVTMNNNKQMYTGDGTGVHGNAGGATSNYFMFPEQSSAVLHNTWNIDNLPNIDPYIPGYQAIQILPNASAQTLYARVLAAFGVPMALAISDIQSFLNQADDDFLGPGIYLTGLVPPLPDIAYNADHRRELGSVRRFVSFMSGFDLDPATGWNDPRQQTTYNRSQDYYMRRSAGW